MNTATAISSQYPFTPKNFTIDGHSLSYLDEGQGPVVVMLHGNPTWSFFYRNLVNLLKGGHRVIVPDHMGCGLSDKPQNYSYTLRTHIDNLHKLLDHLAIKELSLVMHDWGGAIGMGYAVRYQEKVRSLVVMNTAAFRSKRLPWRIGICRLPILGPLLVRGLNGFAWPATFMAVSQPMPHEVKRGFLAPYDCWRNRIAVLRFVQDIPRSPRHRSWETLIEIEAGLNRLVGKPMLICWGGRDFCFSRHFFEEWQRRFPGAEAHYFQAAGHYLLEDAPDDVGARIRHFLNRQPPV